jgi:acyl-homoserine-lactone acylase
MLLGNPHFPWVGTSRFYQMHLTIPGQMDVMGASIGWVSVVQIGFNKDRRRPPRASDVRGHERCARCRWRCVGALRPEWLEIPELLNKGKVTLPAMQAQLFENRNLMARHIIPDLIAACATNTSASDDIRSGCAALKTFADAGYRNNADAKGAVLFREFWRTASQIPGVYREPFNKARPVDTPTGLKFSDAATASKIWEALGDAVKKMRDAGFAPDVALGQVQRAIFSDADIALHGGDEIEGVLNNLGDRGRPGISQHGIRIDYGTSYVQTVTFDEQGPVAQALLTYGQSTNPASPHQTDQLRLYAAKQWPSLPFHPQDIARQRLGDALVLKR